MNKIKTYLDPINPEHFNIQNEWISDKLYTEIVRKTVISCTDAIVTLKGDEKSVYLSKRCVLPMQGVWFLGGRIFFNDQTLEDSVARCVDLETGVNFASNRFNYICTNLYSWAKVAQGNHPGKNLALLYVLEVSKEELDRMSAGLNDTEYYTEFGLQRFDRKRLVDEQVHPAVLDAFDIIFYNNL